ncbi:MAG: hypothetical protein ACI8ZM_002553 [Crocinitomix sp.]|jgi:hypothetical protein
MRPVLLLLPLMVIISCQKDDPIEPEPCEPDNYLYYSDYFVFVSDDGGEPLIVPMDINWTPTETGYNSEFKGWYGTNEEWPIGYYLNDSIVDLCEVPQESWGHADGPYFQFDASNRQVISTIWEAPEIQLTIPESNNWIQTPAATSKAIYGCQTTATVDGELRSGWLIYERIRREELGGSFGDFEAFFWIPVVVDGVFYHFEQHRGEQLVSKWEDVGGEITVSTLPNFDLTILGESEDATSGRTNIPDTINVIAADWGLNLKMASTGSQVGHGPSFPNGLAYYRQSLLVSTDDSEDTGHGLLELILEDD